MPMKTISAIYEQGVFRPLSEVQLPESSPVEVLIPESADGGDDCSALNRVLDKRFRSGRSDLAQRHDEHQS